MHHRGPRAPAVGIEDFPLARPCARFTLVSAGPLALHSTLIFHVGP